MTNANLNAAQMIIATLVHTAGTTVEITGAMTQKDISAAAKAAGNPISPTSLRELMKGDKENIGGWSLKKPEGATETQSNAGATDGGDTTSAPEASNAPQQPAIVELTAEQKALADKVEAELPTKDAEKKTLRGTDWSKVLPTEPQPVKRDSMMHRLFVFLCTPGGVTKDAILKEFTWSPGGLSGILHWEPKAKGYFLKSEKKDGVVHYSLCFHTAFKGGAEPTPVQPEEVLIRETNVANTGLAEKIKGLKQAAGIPVKETAPRAVTVKKDAAPSDSNEPAAPSVTPAAAANANKAPKTPKNAGAQIPASAGNITKRVSAKKAQQAAK